MVKNLLVIIAVLLATGFTAVCKAQRSKECTATCSMSKGNVAASIVGWDDSTKMLKINITTQSEKRELFALVGLWLYNSNCECWLTLNFIVHGNQNRTYRISLAESYGFMTIHKNTVDNFSIDELSAVRVERRRIFFEDATFGLEDCIF